MNNVIKAKLETLPDKSGVYIMLDKNGSILYVGKAKILKNRVRQYFHNSVKNEKTYRLVEKIEDFKYIITQSEYEALLLENNLIKDNNPPYNILLKDDHTYPYIKIDVKKDYPKLEIAYKLKPDGAKYFGPYMLGISIRELIDIVQAIFPLRDCKTIPKKECLNYHIGRCIGPCIHKDNKSEYDKIVEKVIKFLNGDESEVKEILTKKMMHFAEKEEYETAKIYRDILQKLDGILRKQSTPFKQKVDIDVFTFVTNGVNSVINCFVVRGGKYLGGTNYRCIETDIENGLTSFIMQYYERNPLLASEILVNYDISFNDSLKQYIKSISNKDINIYVPTTGMRKEIVDLGVQNGAEFLKNIVEKQENFEELTMGAVYQLQKALNLDKAPYRMECYDISHIGGTNKVASMVVFKNGQKAGNLYRHFKIKTVEGNNDFASMYETLYRRFEELKLGKDVSFKETPDLIVVDGGKGQLKYALKAMQDAGLNLNICALAKREEEIFVPNKEESIIIPRTSLAVKLIMRIRDESHRFAITFHRNQRNKKMTESKLLKIPGIGKAKVKLLMNNFRTLDNIKKADLETLTNVNGITNKDAVNIIDFFKDKNNN